MVKAKKKDMDNLDDYKQNKIFIGNELVLSLNRMNVTPMKVFELIISKVDPELPPEDNTITIEREEINKFFGKNSINRKYLLRETIEELQKESQFFIREFIDGVEEYHSLMPIPSAKWDSKGSAVRFRLDKDLLPYITELKNNFTSYDLEDIRKLKSKYGIVIYRILIMHFNQYLYYSKKKTKRQDQIDAFRNPVISLDEIRFITDTKNKYKRFGDFKERVLTSAIDDINENTNYHISCDTVRTFKKITDLQFHIEQKRIAPIAPHDHPDYPEKEAKKRQNNAELYAATMAHKYTKILRDSFLVKPDIFFDQKKMNEFGSDVYPLYEEIEKRRGEEGVKRHLNYVKRHKTPLSEAEFSQGKDEAIVGYLRTCAEQFLKIIKTEQISSDEAEFQMDDYLNKIEKDNKKEMTSTNKKNDEITTKDPEDLENEIKKLLEELKQYKKDDQ